MGRRIILHPGREKVLHRRHPWIFSGAVREVVGDPQPGETVEIFSSEGEWLARGAYSPHSQIRVRVWTWNQAERVDQDFFDSRLRRAIEARHDLLLLPEIEAYREVHSESDGIPGLVVDRYGPYRVVQVSSTGAEAWREAILDSLMGIGVCAGIYERSDIEARQLEGMAARQGLLRGNIPPEPLTIQEYGLRIKISIREGHKTGFYLDQRENRRRFHALVEGRKNMLDAFCYTGGFTLAGLAAGVEWVEAVDRSEQALAVLKENLPLNGFDPSLCKALQADVFQQLREYRDRNRSFDVIVLDPPKFAPTSSQVEAAARGYKDINLLAFKLLRAGGLLVTFSCSSGVTPELFQKIVASAAEDAGIRAQIIHWLDQPSDHPVLLAFPEGRYLKGLVCRVLEI